MLGSTPVQAKAVPEQSTPSKSLNHEIRRVADLSNATVGASVLHIESAQQAGFNETVWFPLASTYKVAMAAAALDLVDRGELTLDQMIEVPERSRVVSSVITENLPHHGVALSIHNLLDLMLRESDNTATDLLLEQSVDRVL